MAIIVKYIAGRKFTKTDEGRNYTEYTRRAGGATVTVRLRRLGPHIITYQCNHFVHTEEVLSHEDVGSFIEARSAEHDALDARFARSTRRRKSSAGIVWACAGYVVGVAVGALAAATEAAKKA